MITDILTVAPTSMEYTLHKESQSANSGFDGVFWGIMVGSFIGLCIFCLVGSIFIYTVPIQSW